MQGDAHLGHGDPGGDAGRRRQANEAQGVEQGDAKGDVHPYRDQGEDHRCARVLPGEEGGLEDLYEDEGGQAPTVLEQDQPGGDGVLLDELAPGEEAVHQVDRHGHQGGGGGKAEGHAEHQGLIHDRAAFLGVLLREGPGELGQQGHADGRSDQGQGELVEAVRDAHPDPQARDMRGQHGGDEDVHLDGRGGHRSGDGQADEPADLGGQPGQGQANPGTGAAHAPRAEPGLGHAGDDGRPGGRVGGGDGILLGQDRSQHADVQDHRIGTVDDEPSAGGEDPGQQGGHHHAGKVGHGDLREGHRQAELRRVLDVAGRVDQHDPGHGQLGEDGQDHGGGGHGGQGVGGQAVGLGVAFSRQLAGIGRHEGGGEGPLGEDPPEQVREGLGGEEGVGGYGLAGAHSGRDHQVPGEAEEAADQGQSRKHHRGPDQAAARCRRRGGRCLRRRLGRRSVHLA